MNVRLWLLYIVSCVCLSAMALDGVEVTNVVSRKRYPWNWKVDIAFTITGDAGADLPDGFKAERVAITVEAK